MNSPDVFFYRRWTLLCFYLSAALILSGAFSRAAEGARAAADTTVSADTVSGSALTADSTVFFTPVPAFSADSKTTTDTTQAAGRVPSREVPADSLPTAPVSVPRKLPERIPFHFSPFDTVSYESYLLRHPFSFDHFFETVPGYILYRLGPIGADVFLSRFGMGLGRATVCMAGVPINDPQNDIAPLVLFPTTTIQTVVLDNRSSDVLYGRAGLEGSIGVQEREPLPDRPYTAFELSKGRFDLRQRRIRFASAFSNLGVDLGYDELLNNGYSYDPVINAEDFGRSRCRFHTMNLRGKLPNGESYFFSFRWFKDTFKGDIFDPWGERRRSGHFAIASTTLRSWRFRFYQRGYDVSLPDSHTVNHTTAAYAVFRPNTGKTFDSEVGFGLEDIVSKQAVGGAEANPKLRRGSLGARTTYRVSAQVRARIELAVGFHFQGKAGWGGRSLLFYRLTPSNELSVDVGRGFRLPNLGERFLPLHSSGVAGVDGIGGNRYLDPESFWEAGVRLRSMMGIVENETRLTGIRVRDEIAFFPVVENGETWLLAGNGGNRRIGLLEERLSVRGFLKDASVRLSGGWVYAFGEREGFFRHVPESRLDATFSVGGDFFASSSSLLLAAEYQYNSTRNVFPGGDLPPYGMLNLKLDARLLDAHLYLLWLNVFDKNFRTGGPLLLTPRTLVYGVQWAIFN